MRRPRRTGEYAPASASGKPIRLCTLRAPRRRVPYAACVEPVHVRIATDHLVLIDPASLEITGEEAAALLDTARPLIEELGVKVQAPHASRWYLSSPQLAGLAGAAPLRASGRNIEIWLPHETRTGERSRAWMKLQNEVQMAWFRHPVNEARDARGVEARVAIGGERIGVAQQVLHGALGGGGALANIGDAAPIARNGRARHPCAAPEQFAAVDRIEKREGPQKHALARARRAGERDPLARREREIARGQERFTAGGVAAGELPGFDQDIGCHKCKKRKKR